MDAAFTDLRWSDRTLRFHARVGHRSDEIWVELPQGAQCPGDDLLAVFFAILSGPNLTSLEMDLSVTPRVRHAVEDFCGVELQARESPQPSAVGTSRLGHAVSFSGGFDSLAALSLVPAGAHLVSLDFGGWFEREREFFQTFDTHVVRTNFRSAGFDRHSWLFMLTGLVLLRDYLDLSTYTTGAILESTPWNYQAFIDSTPATPELLRAVGLEKVNTVNGLTEVATTLLAMRHFPGRIDASLESLAAPGSGKRLRKQMLVAALYREGRAELPAEPSYDPPSFPPLKYGDSLADDTLMPYILQHLGSDAAASLMSDIPREVQELAAGPELKFYLRYHPGFYTCMPVRVKRALMLEFVDSGLDPYTEGDWRDFRRVTDVLRDVHVLPR